MAFLYFSQQEVDFAVIEVGMGGRLDATNIIIPEVSIITNVDFDHMDHLGETKHAIAREKAAIIKESRPLITAETDPTILTYLKEVCNEKHSQFYLVNELQIIPKDESLTSQSFHVHGAFNGEFSISMLGQHQQINAATALLAIQALRDRNIALSNAAIKEGLTKAVWPGRLQFLSTRPLILLDGAHNVAGMKTAVEFLKRFPKKKVLILGIAHDKEIAAMVKLIAPLFGEVIVTKGNYKPTPTEILAAEVEKYAKVTIVNSPRDALDLARQKAQDDELIFITGSLYLIGDILSIFR